MGTFVWDLDPTIATLGPLQLRYYGLLFGATLLLGYHLFRKRLEKYGFDHEVAERYLLWAVASVVIGARLVHCLFYDPEFYLSNPVEILKIYKGGIASHGATLGLFVVSLWFVFSHNRRNRALETKRRKKGREHTRMRFLHLGDSVVFAAAVGATFVRIGNFFNSEIVGRLTDQSWGVAFLRYNPDYSRARQAAAGVCDVREMECLIKHWPLRHPSQFYEAVGGLAVLVTLLVIDRMLGKRQMPGIFSGVFLTMYFTFRFFIEFIKEYQALQTSFLTMGQYLSIPFVLAGVWFIVSAVRNAENAE